MALSTGASERMMEMEAVARRIEQGRVIAIARLNDGSRLMQIAEALLAGGLGLLEFTLTTPGALEALAEARAAFGDEFCLGIGTVLDLDSAVRSVAAGAQFLVTPILRHDVVQFCKDENIVCICGAMTPSEMQTAWEWGSPYVKCFPANVGGPSYLRDVLAPLPHLRLITTGGVTTETAPQYLAAGAVAVAVGSQLIDKQLIAAGRFDEITARARAFAQLARTPA
jgi:2-dehydro-3-deoxyphosphogluconate aldolase/(4S)-4-hydroxy-2-oxoglutarate aldolase